MSNSRTGNSFAVLGVNYLGLLMAVVVKNITLLQWTVMFLLNLIRQGDYPTSFQRLTGASVEDCFLHFGITFAIA